VTKEKNRLSLWWRVVKQRLRVRCLSLLGDNARYVFVQNGDTGFLVDPADNHVSRQLLKTGVYNPDELARYRALIKETDTVLVVGGHIGSIALPLSRSCKSMAIIEANPRTFELLHLNTKVNDLKNVRLFNFAAGSSCGSIDFVMSSENSGGSKIFPINRQDHYLYDDPGIVTVELSRIDDMFDEQFDVVIMDIEGSEFSAISGAQNILMSARVFICEYFPNHLRDIAGVSAYEFSELVESLQFDEVTFPKLGWQGSGKANLHEPFLEVEKSQSTEDGVVFLRSTETIG